MGNDRVKQLPAFLSSLSPALNELGQVLGFQDVVCSKACAFSSCVFLVLVWFLVPVLFLVLGSCMVYPSQPKTWSAAHRAVC